MGGISVKTLQEFFLSYIPSYFSQDLSISIHPTKIPLSG